MSNRIPSLNWLRVFEAAARTESFAKAATQLNISAPAVSQQIKALEGHLGAQLFHRRAHSVELTPTGRAFLPSVQHAIVSVESTADGLFGQTRQETLYVQSVLIFAMGFLNPRIERFRKAHPEIILQLTTGNVVEDFTRGFTDMQIIFGNPATFGRQGDKLLGERLYPVARPELAERIGAPEDLLAHPLLEVATHHAGWVNFLNHVKTGAVGADLVFADSTVMSFSTAANGSGIALARAPTSDTLETAFGLRPCLPDTHIDGAEHYHLIYPNRATLRPAARIFRDWLLSETEELERIL
jgi:DNA-binding transcriptional LysR family regulator